MTSFSRKLLTIFLLCVLVNAVFSYKNASAAGFVFTRSLKMGMSGEDVRELQKILNSDVVSRIRDAGPGSPGQETTYFGTLTQVAVVRFQEKYRNEILIPNGLLTGNGFVGPSTRAVLEKVVGTATSNTYSVSKNNMSPQTVPTPITPIVSSIVTTTENPNTKNLDKFFAAIDWAGQKKGLSSSDLGIIKSQIIRDIATSTDLRETFLNIVKSKISQTPTPLNTVIGRISQALKTSFFPKRAKAASGVPFGGALLFQFFCTCSANWLITLEPLPPAYPVLLSYEPESQMYLSYNIPFTNWLLGEEEPGAGICQVYAGLSCVSIPSEGMISPMTGSSPL